MSQYPITITNGTGAQVLTELDQAFIASVTMQSGSTVPSTTYSYMFWLDTSTTPSTLRMMNAANNAFVAVGTIDPNLGFIPSGTPANAGNATTLNGQLAAFYATAANATLTGIPVAPTAATATNTTQVATTAFVQNVVANINYSSFAPLASPALSGIPTCPTAASGTNNNQIASTSFVQTAVAVYNNSNIIRGSISGGSGANTIIYGGGFALSGSGSGPHGVIVTFTQQMATTPTIIVSSPSVNYNYTISNRTANGFYITCSIPAVGLGSISYPPWEFIAFA
jgi:hypothetical protein